MPDNTPFPERWLAASKAARPHSDTLASIEDALTDEGVDEARLLARLKALTTTNNTWQDQ
jgi:hypothetical protein